MVPVSSSNWKQGSFQFKAGLGADSRAARMVSAATRSLTEDD